MPLRRPKNKIPAVSAVLNFPPAVVYLLVLCRSNSLLDSVLHCNRHTIQQDNLIIKKFFYPDDVLAWKDRKQDSHLLVIETESDSLFFREEVGRVKLFFSHTILYAKQQ